ncbi:MAG TPA: PAS domain-containing sensor histidine kinase, partial [Verrucomicrobiae bacterium]|nr:PAS domain-containing sensor histidine kinase [Verrucomicrobiae bacterium]
MGEALAGGMPIFEWSHQQPDGRLISTEVRLLRLPSEGGDLIRASIIDNTERKRAERTLRESEEKSRALFEGSSQGVVLHDENGLLEVNPAAVRIMGRNSPAELIGKHPRELAPLKQPNGETSEVMGNRYIKECLEKGSARFEWVACAPDGREIPLEVALTRIQWSGRQIIQAFITDITERKQAERALREANRELHLEIEQRKRSQTALAESEARFSAAFQASPILIAIARMSDERFVLANDAFVNWAGYSREDILGRKTTEFSVWEHVADREAFWANIRNGGSLRERECCWRNRWGKRFTMLMSSEVIQLNHVPHLLCLALDITARKQAEVEMLKALAREKELSQLKSNFVSMVSHEFRTPLGIIQSSAELLRDFIQRMPPEERQEQLESITRNTRRMAGMMEEILVLSRLEAGKLDFRPCPLDLNSFCRRVVDEVWSATNRRCPIELSLVPVLPTALADERLLEHVFTNLLSNAVKYSEPGEPVEFGVCRDG